MFKQVGCYISCYYGYQRSLCYCNVVILKARTICYDMVNTYDQIKILLRSICMQGLVFVLLFTLHNDKNRTKRQRKITKPDTKNVDEAEFLVPDK